MSRKPYPVSPPLTLDQLIAQSSALDNNQGHPVSPPPHWPFKIYFPLCNCHLNLWLMELTSVGIRVPDWTNGRRFLLAPRRVDTWRQGWYIRPT